MKKYKAYDYSLNTNKDEWLTPDQIRALKPALDECRERSAKNYPLINKTKGDIVKAINHSDKKKII